MDRQGQLPSSNADLPFGATTYSDRNAKRPLYIRKRAGGCHNDDHLPRLLLSRPYLPRTQLLEQLQRLWLRLRCISLGS